MLGGFSCSKNALTALNILYILVGILLITVAAYGRMIAIVSSIALVGGIIASGVFLFLVACVGVIGAQKHHQVLLFFYMIILFLVFLIQFAVACACLAVNQEQERQIFDQGWRYSHKSTRDEAQHAFNCCARDKPSQGYLQQDGLYCANSLCCTRKDASNKDVLKDAFCCSGLNGTSTDCPCPGCYETIQPCVERTLKISGGIGLFFSFTEIIGVWLALRYRNQKDPRANPSAFL